MKSRNGLSVTQEKPLPLADVRARIRNRSSSIVPGHIRVNHGGRGLCFRHTVVFIAMARARLIWYTSICVHIMYNVGVLCSARFSNSSPISVPMKHANIVKREPVNYEGSSFLLFLKAVRCSHNMIDFSRLHEQATLLVLTLCPSRYLRALTCTRHLVEISPPPIHTPNPPHPAHETFELSEGEINKINVAFAIHNANCSRKLLCVATCDTMCADSSKRTNSSLPAC